MKTFKKVLVTLTVVVIVMMTSFASAGGEEFKSLASMGDFEINKYIDFYVPNDFELVDAETVEENYTLIKEQPVLTNGKVDIVLHLEDIKLSNKKSEVEAARNGIAKNLAAVMQKADFDTKMTLKYGKKYFALIRFGVMTEDIWYYTIVAVFEVNSKLAFMSYTIRENLLESQEVFSTILSKMKFK